MTTTRRYGEYVRVPYIFGDEVLRFVLTNSVGDRVLVEVPIEDGEGRIVEYIHKWVSADGVEVA
jgi:hypothetical protein